MLLTARQAVTFANDLARGFGLKNAEGARLELPEPRDDRRVPDLIRRLRAALEVVRPIPTAPSISEALTAVIETNSRTARRNLAELDALFVKATGRAKRADRARLFAQLLVLFDLEKAVGVTAAGDPEETVERVRHGMEKWRRRARGWATSRSLLKFEGGGSTGPDRKIEVLNPKGTADEGHCQEDDAPPRGDAAARVRRHARCPSHAA